MKRVGYSYTASCYTNMYSLFATIAEGMIGKTVVVYSYGSGSAATMYRLRIGDLPTFDRDVFKRCAPDPPAGEIPPQLPWCIAKTTW